MQLHRSSTQVGEEQSHKLQMPRKHQLIEQDVTVDPIVAGRIVHLLVHVLDAVDPRLLVRDEFFQVTIELFSPRLGLIL